MSKTVLVTGATGYVGVHVVTALLDRGARVIALDRNAGLLDARAIAAVGDLRDVERDILPAHGVPDACLHLAWSDGFNHNAPSHMEHLSGHFAFLAGLARAGVKQLAVLGTMHEVGYWHGAIDETTPTNPASFYGIAKNALRQALTLEMARRETVFQWIRAFYILGDYARGQSIFSKILAWEREGRASFPFNSGSNQYDFIELDALARQIAATVMQDQVTGVINCCSGVPVSLKDKVEAFLHEQGLAIRPEYGAFPDRAYDSPAVWGDDTKIKTILRG